MPGLDKKRYHSSIGFKAGQEERGWLSRICQWRFKGMLYWDVMAEAAKKLGRDTNKKGEQIVAQNRAASYHYHLLERLEAGLVLHGTEVKALREGKANIRDAFVDFKPSGPWLVNA